MNRLIPVAALLILSSKIVFAQPEAKVGPKVTNPANIPANAEDAFRQAQEQFKKAFGDMAKMTPAQVKEVMRKMQEQGLRDDLDRAGFDDQKLQDKIVAFVAEEEKSREEVRKAATKIYLALEPEGRPVGKQDMSVFLEEYLNAVEDAQERRKTTTKSLDKAINFTANPHLKAFLILNGIVGDASAITGDIASQGAASTSALSTYVMPAAPAVN